MAEVGDTVARDGLVLLLRAAIGASGWELERKLGLATCCLVGGYRLGLLVDEVLPGDFARPVPARPLGADAEEGPPPSPAPAPAPLEALEALLHGGMDRLSRDGPDRLCKLFPIRAASAYEVGAGHPRVKLLRPKRFEIAVEVGPGKRLFRDGDGTLKVL
jgi:hypothetical protein